MSDIVEIGGHKYRIGRIDARKQFHVARRLAPLLAGMSGALGADRGAGFGAFIGPLTEALSGMSDDDVDYVLDVCLGVCQRLQPNGQGAPVIARSGGLMFEDIDMGQMIQLAVKVIQENLSGFFPGAAAA
ncbi:hypothetical protein G3N58_17600 [Paraburkholderia sp. Ac-20342]|uniref:phage tail assembly chaperone n=1 Tax=Paraburkholderia sp. Ac-20342 TaxID=2703889 RepID=UPI001981266C|nr:hypothetical protein [Paraburkholderia sp. Ac-20342]MBN3848623.1 hypothetical protein [Paraburkholderia sp. Ac-20342]